MKDAEGKVIHINLVETRIQTKHGDIVHIPIGTAAASNSGGTFTSLQIVLMAVCVVWGSIGTTLYFLRRKA